MNWIWEPFQYGFMQRALLAALLISATCASLGVYVVLRRMAFLGDAIAHTTLPGLAIAYLNRWNLLVGALLAALLTALGIGWLSRRRLDEDTAIGVLFSGMFALGIALLSQARSSRDLSHLLFGNILGVTNGDLIGIVLIGLLVAAALVLLSKELILVTLDPQHAQVIGLPGEALRIMLLILLAMTVVTAIQAVGVVLTTALLVTPAATASLLTRKLGWLFAGSIALAMFSSLVGLYASYYWRLPSGAGIVLVCTTGFIFCFAAREFVDYVARKKSRKPMESL
jgi:ABC-type Mn2+/Zn2+ transport system permease subunit